MIDPGNLSAMEFKCPLSQRGEGVIGCKNYSSLLEHLVAD